MTQPNGDQLLQQIRQALQTYVILPSPGHEIAVTLWIAATHAAPAWNTAPRLVIRAPEKRCGQSRLLDIIEALCHKPVMTANASTTALYRLIRTSQGNPPTILIDEADTILRPKTNEYEDLKELLNAGHQRSHPTMRWNASANTVETLDTFAMAALASVGHLPNTIEDQAVITPMKQRAQGEHIKPYRAHKDAPALNQLRQDLNTWARTHHKQLANTTPNLPLQDSDPDPWTPLLAIANAAQGNWPTQAKTAATTLTTQTKELH